MGVENMKKLLSALFTILMIISISTVAFADFRGPVDGLELKSGFNPVARVDENTFDYVIYARDMTGLTNGDFTVAYDPEIMTLVSVKQTGNYTNSVYNDVDGTIYFSFLYTHPNEEDSVKMYILTFSCSKAVQDYPEMEASNVKGTFIKSVKDIQVVEATDDNAVISEGTDRFDDFMQDDKSYYLGDVNGDAAVTPADARLVLRHATHLELLYLEQYLYADYDGDGNVTTMDARLILRKAAGLE